MIRLRIFICLLALLHTHLLLAQLDPCDPPLLASISSSGPVCAGSTVFITFHLPEDVNLEGFDVTYSIGGNSFVLPAIVDGHTVGHIVVASTTATLSIVVENDDDDDDDGCFTLFNQTIPITVSSPNVNITNQTNPGCGQNNGTITASASGGTSPYQYSLNGGVFQSSAVFGALGAGTYTVTARDAAGCTSSNASTTLTSPGAPNVSITGQTNPGCGQNNGTITASASGGTSPYQYSLNGGVFQSSAVFGALGAGTYTVAARDAAGCTSSNAATTLTSPGAPNVSIVNQTNPGCGQNNGTITAFSSGGTSPYQYSLNGGAFQSSAVFGALGAGNYTVAARDAAGCTSSNAATTLTSPGAPNVSIVNQTNPGCGQSNGTITASASGGTSPYQYSLNGGAFQSSAVFGNLVAGNYHVVARDASGCTSSAATTTLTSPNPANSAIQANTTQGCSNTVFTLTGNLPLGTAGLWTSSALQPPTPANPVWILDNLPPGNITLTWTLSAPGCPNYNASSIVLQVSPPPQANTDGVFQVEQGGEAAVEVLLNDVANSPLQLRILKSPSQGVAFFNNQDILEYQPDAAANGNDTVVYELCYLGCPETCDTALVLFRNLRNDDPCVLNGDTSNIFTNGLTPNGDGRNDQLFFRVVSVEDCEINYAKSDIIIYNRWGDVVFEASPYNNDWGGTNRNGNNLPPGVYYFVLRVTLDEVYSQFGSVIIIR